MTPSELYDKVVRTVDEQEDWIKALATDVIGIRHGEISLPANYPTTVSFFPPFPSGVTDYMIWRQVEMPDGTLSEVEITNRTENSFVVTSPTDCVFKYLTTKPQL